jgi:hypothetical protein
LKRGLSCVWQTWRRPTLPRLETKYHWRWSVSRPSSEWDRVQPLRHDHQVGETHIREAGVRRTADRTKSALSVLSSSVICCPDNGRSPQARLRVAGGPAPLRSIGPEGRSCVSEERTIRLRRMGIRDENDQAGRAISTGKLHALPHVHTRPIDVVVFHGSSGNTRFQVGFPLRCLQRLSRPYIATLLCGWRHNRSTRDTSIPVLSY